MSKKTIKANSVNTTQGHVEFEQPTSDFDAVVQMAVEKAEEQPKEPEPIYLVDTLIKLEEIEKYGLNKYMIHAILPDNTYTLSEAKARIEACIKGFKK